MMFALLFIGLSTNAFSADDTPKGLTEINLLIKAVADSGCDFVRNGDSHPAPKAAEHLSMKLDNAARSWFAPDKDEWTAEMFIKKIATKSSLSGDPYWINCAEEGKVHSADWLRARLKEIRTKKKDPEGS